MIARLIQIKGYMESLVIELSMIDCYRWESLSILSLFTLVNRKNRKWITHQLFFYILYINLFFCPESSTTCPKIFSDPFGEIIVETCIISNILDQTVLKNFPLNLLHFRIALNLFKMSICVQIFPPNRL